MTLIWPVSYSEAFECDALQTMALDGQAMFADMAATYLWNWTGRAFGLTALTIRPKPVPARPRPSTFWGRGPYVPSLLWQADFEGTVMALHCGTCGSGRCSCRGGTAYLKLPGPIYSVQSVTIDGTVLDPANYRVDDQSVLVRLDGKVWPISQNSLLPTTEPGTWQIAYTRGQEVPNHGKIAAGILACELAKAAVGDSSCRLPQRITSITRQGMTMTMLDTFNDIDAGHTGIFLIDSWVASVTKPARAGVVRSVDIR